MTNGTVSLLALALSAASLNASTTDGGGRDVSVALFSTHTLRAVTVTPVGENVWVAHCAQCVHQPLGPPLKIVAPMDIFAGGTLRVTDELTGEVRTASGMWHMRATGHDRAMQIDVVLTMPSERYVIAVLNAEAAAGEPPQSLRALAILARTYALNGIHYTAAPGHLAAELCDSTQCQAMRLTTPSQTIEDATRATSGETLWFGTRRADVFFSQSCGGVTEDAAAVWPRLLGAPYLRSHADPYCLRRDAAAWHAEIPLKLVSQIAQGESWRVPTNIVTARVLERSASHRALRVAFGGGDGKTAIISATALRFGIGRALGWDYVRSDAYDVSVRNGALIFDGHGHGHGVGLCQMGATEMASKGKSAQEILVFYFSGTAVHIVPGDESWQDTQAGPLMLRATHSFPALQRAELEQVWRTALARFTPLHPVQPEITFAPTTEVFRQMTGEPGWTLASTRGITIVLQPESVLRANGEQASALLHEMLHVLVEAESSSRAPLWLREGLVEVLAGDRTGVAQPVSRIAIDGVAIDGIAIDDALRHADSLHTSQRAHRAAAARVQSLMTRYGASAVRGWLASGVPAGTD